MRISCCRINNIFKYSLTCLAFCENNKCLLYFTINYCDISYSTAWTEEKTNINNSSLTPSSSISLNSTNVDFATNIEFIKGHLSAAISNKETGNNELAQTHTFHPIHEIYTLIRNQISSADNELNNTLINSLNNLTSIVFKSTPAEFVNLQIL